MLLRHLPSGGRLRSIEDRIQSPEIPITHDLPEILLRRQQGRRHPAFHHAAITPAADSPSPHTDPRMGTLDDVGGGQTAMQRGWHIQPVDRETLFQPFHQAGGGRRIFSFQPLGQFLEPLAKTRWPPATMPSASTRVTRVFVWTLTPS